MCKRFLILLTFVVVLGLVGTNIVFGDVIEVRVAADEDDAEEDVATGVMESLTSSDLEITEEGSPADNQLVGMRFNNIDIPQGSTIIGAYVQFHVDEVDVPGDNRPGTKFLRGEAVDNAAAFSSADFDISSRPTTSAEASWDWPEWLTEHEEGPDQQTSDIAAVIQEIVDRPGWAAGNSLALIITGSGENTAESFGDEPDAPPLLHVEFTAGGGGSQEPLLQDGGPDGIVSVEAENFHANTPGGVHTWELVGPTDGFTGVAGMQSLPNDGLNTDSPDDYLNGPRLDYEVFFVTSGTHYVWLRAWSGTGSDDSCHVGLDGQATGSADRIDGFNAEYVWTNHTRDPERATIDITEAGVHTLNLYMREDGSIIDKIVLTTNPDYVPEGDGPAESGPGLPVGAYGAIPGNGAIDVENNPVLSWIADETAFQHDVYLGTDADLVAAGDASVLQGSVADASFAPADALGRGITYYWKVDVTTGSARASEFHPGNVWSFRVVDRNTDNWAATATADSPAYLDTFVEDGLYDIGALSGDITYEFVVISNPDETEASMALIGRRQFGDTQVGIKYEQWNNTGTYGATVFGVVDLDYGVPTAPGEYTHLTFVSSEATATTALYVNGVLEGSVDSAITLSGLVGIGHGAQGADGSESFDNFDGTIFGVAIYDAALSADTIAKHSDSYFTPIAITDPNLLIHYDFESGEGLTVVDRSGHGNHSLFFGNPEWATGIFGGALAVDIADLDYIQTVAPLNIVTNTITVAGWVKHDESPAAWSGILTHRGTDPGSFGLQHNGEELRYMWGPDIYWDVSTGLALPNGEWYFAAIAISPDQAKFYLNGVGEGQTFTNVAEHVPTNFDSEIRVGRDHNDGRIMTSLIDEVRFYDKTLTDVEILKLIGAVSDITGPGDIVQGVPNDGDWPGAETPDLAVDDDTSTKYLHFKGSDEPTGFQIAPASGASIVTGLTFTTANDAIERDPISFELSGSNESIDGPYELIASGDIVDFAQETAIERFTMNGTAIMFDNDVSYKYYQVMFPAVRDPASANSMQIAEVELLGVLDSLVAHWKLDDGAGTVAIDSSGNGNDGVLVGDPQWVEGAVGGALSFDGVDDYVDCGNPEVLDITENLTLMCWIKVAAFSKTWETILSKGDDSYRMSRGPGNGDSIHFGANGTGDNLDAVTIVTTDTWRHVALVFNGTEKITYIDGAEDVRAPASGTINSSGFDFYIGQNSQQANRFLTGAIDDVRIYNQALSAADISGLASQ